MSLGVRYVLASSALALCGCEDLEPFVPLPGINGPAGVLEGSVTYVGPRPCTRDGRVAGNAILLAFDVRRLPPPEGLGTTAESLAVVPGDTLFRGIGLEHAPDGSLHCPDPNDTVTVSAPWTLGPLDAGVYQVRGLYDMRGDFDPAFSISNLPTQGDVVGGAIDNAAEVLAGAPPEFRRIELGVAGPDGEHVMPPSGARVPGIAVTLGLTLPLERPVFHVREVLDPAGLSPAPGVAIMASDHQLARFDLFAPDETEASFVRLVLGAGVPPSEVDAAAAPPLSLPIADPPTLLVSRLDVDADGDIDGEDAIPETNAIPALGPAAAFVRVAPASPSGRVVVVQGLTLHESLFQTAMAPPDLVAPSDQVVVALRPAALCVDPARPDAPATLVLPHDTDAVGNPLVSDPVALAEKVGAQLGRAVVVEIGCLPEGVYAQSLVYTTGQAWTVPNEAGVCAELEPPSADGTSCGSRPRLASQAVALTIAPPSDPTWCASHPTPPACLE